MEPRKFYIWSGVIAGSILAVVLIRGHIARKKIKALKEQEMDPKEKVADVQKNFENNQDKENW